MLWPTVKTVSGCQRISATVDQLKTFLFIKNTQLYRGSDLCLMFKISPH